jgi:hypothetical protein
MMDPLVALDGLAEMAALDSGRRWAKLPPGALVERASPEVREALRRLTSDMTQKHTFGTWGMAITQPSRL